MLPVLFRKLAHLACRGASTRFARCVEVIGRERPAPRELTPRVAMNKKRGIGDDEFGGVPDDRDWTNTQMTKKARATADRTTTRTKSSETTTRFGDDDDRFDDDLEDDDLERRMSSMSLTTKTSSGQQCPGDGAPYRSLGCEEVAETMHGFGSAPDAGRVWVCEVEDLEDLNLIYRIFGRASDAFGMTRIMPPYVFKYSGLSRRTGASRASF